MPIGTPFHSRTAELCTSLFYKDWAGYYTVSSYDTCHEREYYALRNAAGLIDVSPLYKYEIHGKDAAAFLSRVMTRNIGDLKVGRCTYLCWCDDYGKVLDDGTVSRLDDTYFRVTAAEPTLSWLMRQSRRFDVTIEDSTDRIGTLSLQGPNSRDILKNVSDADMDSLRYFGLTKAKPMTSMSSFPEQATPAISAMKSGSSANRPSRSTMPSRPAAATTESSLSASMRWTSRASKRATS